MDLPFEINASSEPRWSRSNPNVIYYRYNAQLKQYDIGTRTKSVVRDFSGDPYHYSVISGYGESDISFDGDHFVFVGDHRYVFVYEISTDTPGPVLDTAGVPFDSVYITPDNNVLISWQSNGLDSGGTSQKQGMELFDRNMKFLRQVTPANGHKDVTRDTNGDEVLVWFNANDPANDPNAAPNCPNGVVKIRLADAAQTCLLTFDWSLAGHVSATDNSGWVFVETYTPSNPIPPSSWFTYTDELLQVKLDGTQVRRLAHHRSRPYPGCPTCSPPVSANTYTYEPKLSVSRDGRKLAYSSNFGLQWQSNFPSQYSDAYLINVDAESPGTAGTAFGGVTITSVTKDDSLKR